MLSRSRRGEAVTLHDMNQSWTPPEGYWFDSISAQGAYLVVQYHQSLFVPGTRTVKSQNQVVIYLNDIGREVSRTHEQKFYPVLPEPVQKTPDPISSWVRFKNGFFMVLIG